MLNLKSKNLTISRISLSFVFLLCLLLSGASLAQNDPKLTEQWTPVPAIIAPGDKDHPPSDAIILFNGANLDEWTSQKNEAAGWVVSDGILTVKPGTGVIKTKRKFEDCQLHIEFRTPSEIKGEGQGRGNSGIFLQGRYEVQVLDSYNNVTYSNGQAGSIYKQYIPLVNASKGPGEWQSYDIIFTAPRFDADKSLNTPAFITVLHNGVIIQNHVQLKGPTRYIGVPEYIFHEPRQSIVLQDHGNPVSYRNIWIREL